MNNINGLYSTYNSTNQFSLGQTTLEAVLEQVRRQLQGHLTYFLPLGGGAMGCME